ANIFVYHRFNDSRYPSTNISLQDFRAHLDILSQQKFSVLTLGQVVDRLQKGLSLPHRCAVITVDDAYRSFLTDGWPLLKQYGYQATLFVSTDTVGGGEYLSWQELRLLQDAGIEIGNHSASHAYLLDRLPSESVADWKIRVTADLSRSQQAFKNRLGSSPTLFAYPYGEFSPALVSLVKAEGFIAAFGQQSGVVAAGMGFFDLPRFPVGGGYASPAGFRNKLFMHRLAARIISPESTVVQGENPPKLRFYLSQEDVDNSSLRCFVSGQPDCLIREVAGEDRVYEVEANEPLSGRRSKYTLTASDLNGKSWYWFSQLWVQPRGREMADAPVSR
ncbi:MAG: polysaccharide deacetylase family protein, partial [Desulfuromonadales bacterium]|nr:polysaccharide deacetylase family protein [Desulfuromonadales bacterium]